MRVLSLATRHPTSRRLIEGILRLSTYSHAPEIESAGAAIEQLKLGLFGGVRYLDGGWQSLVDGLMRAALAVGVEFVSGRNVTRVAANSDRGWCVSADDGSSSKEARAVVLAVSPRAAARMTEGPAKAILADWAEASVPARAACLDVALSRLPNSKARFAIGIGAPLYYSVHSTSAKLAPPGGATIALAQYLRPGEAPSPDIEPRLEAILDRLQAGWRDHLVWRRFLPALTVSHALVTAQRGGCAGRPGSCVPGSRGLYVVGDWVGKRGLLADASFASAEEAAMSIVQIDQVSKAA